MRFNLERLGEPLAFEMTWRNGRRAPMLKDPVDAGLLVVDTLATDAAATGAADVIGGGLFDAAAGDAAAGDIAAGAAGDVVAGAAGNVVSDVAGSASALNPGVAAAGDTVAGSGPAVTSSAASTPAATDTATNVASKLDAVKPAFADSYMTGAAEDAGVASGNAANAAAANGSVPGAAGTSAAAKPGLIQSVLDFMKENQAGLVSGGLQAIGGLGKAGVDQQTMIKKALLEKQNQIELAQWQDSFNHGAAAGPFTISPGSNVLLRNDGTPVYAAGSGLINRARV